MPELPEVETVRRALDRLLKGKIVKDIDIYYPGIIRTPNDTQLFKLSLIGETINKVDRRGKYLLFAFDTITLISHLRMEGKYLFKNEEILIKDKHVHVVFTFTDSSQLQYKDVRKFGTMDIVEKGQEEIFPSIKKLGQEPIDLNFDIKLFKAQVNSKKTPIKSVLLNQEIVSGLGNIYADEVLAISKINPLRTGNTITAVEISKIFESMKVVLNEAIKRGGSTVRTYESVNGKGSMQNYLIVYGRTGEACKYCGKPIEKIKVAGRGTHYCPNCQRLNK